MTGNDTSQVHIGLGVGADLVGGETIVGRGPGGVRARHVERDRLRNELAVRSYRGAPGRSLLQGTERERGAEAGLSDRASAGAVGHLGPDAYLRGSLLRRQHLQVISCGRALYDEVRGRPVAISCNVVKSPQSRSF